MSKAPNILFICTDQMRYDTPGCNGNAICLTPHIDHIASEGVNFRRAYSPSSVCTPARASLLTGRYAFHHGMLNNCDLYQPAREELPASEPLLTDRLRDAGYRLGHIGKWHVGKQRGPADYGFDGINLPGYGNLPQHPEFLAYLKEHGLSYEIRDPLYFNPEQTGLLAGVWDGPVESTPSHYLTNRMVDLMDEYASHEEPFFLACHFWDPHGPHLPSREFADRHDPASIPPWVNFNDDWQGKPAMIRRMHTDFYRGLPGAWQGWQRIIARYYDFVSMVDYQIGRLLAALQERGLSDNTIVVFTSDHGDMTGGHGGMNDKGFVYEEAHRIPLIIRWPGVLPAGVTRDDLAYNMDILPTICQWLGHSVEGVDGRMLMAIDNQQPPPEPRSSLLLENHGIRFLYSQRALITDDGWKYIFTPGDRDECYNLTEDPGELRNLVDDPSHRDDVERIRERLIDAAVENSDPLATGIARFLGRWRNLTGQRDVSDVRETIV